MINTQTINQLLKSLPKNRTIESSISGLFFYHADGPSQMLGYIQEPSICVVLQGSRNVSLGDTTHSFSNKDLMFCPVNIPININLSDASIAHPIIGLSLRLNLAMIRKVTAKMRPPSSIGMTYLGIKSSLDNDVLLAFERLINLLNHPDDIEFLAPLVQQEIYYRLLTGPQGTKLRQLIIGGSHVQQISRATDWLKANFHIPLIIEKLASECGMSVSSFHYHFKDITGLSPLQYQKKLRLVQARYLVQLRDTQLSQIAMQVGYESPSQFSREYKRLFGISPSRELRAVNTPIYSAPEPIVL